MEKLARTTGKHYNALQLRGLFRMADLDGTLPPKQTRPRRARRGYWPSVFRLTLRHNIAVG